MPYTQKSNDIIKNSITSAIFIDERAREFYSTEPKDDKIIEHRLSEELYKTFKEEGISLAVHKFTNEDLNNGLLGKYILKNRDLVLLDWELEGTSGIVYSLKVLSEVVRTPHINFCCIYTYSTSFDSIGNNVKTFFSGYDKIGYQKVLDTYDYIEKDVFLPQAEKFLLDKNESIEKFLTENRVDIDTFPIKLQNNSISREHEILTILVDIFKGYQQSETKETIITSFSEDFKSFVINNTFIFILQKNIDEDIKPNVLIKRISDKIIENKNSFLQLLGVEMQTIFNDNQCFIDENLLKSSTEALFAHRNYLKEKNKTDIPFIDLIKNVLIEHAISRLRTSNLSLLDTSFLDAESSKHGKIPSDEEVSSINTFYNSVKLDNFDDNEPPTVNFGDIFIDDDEGSYYLCITAVCDCLNPNKIKHNYYFVQGKELSIKTANKLGDTAFVSYIPGNNAINWVNMDIIKPEKVKKGELSDEVFENLKLIAQINAIEPYLYKPAYIKPKYLNLQGSQIIDGKILAREIIYVSKKEEFTEDLPHYNLKYITSLRPNYTQRIANHAFAHPLRVGIDFVSK